MRPFAATGRVALRTWIFGFLISATLTVLSIAYVDRPLAIFIDGHFRHTFGWVVLDRSLEPLKAVAISALFFLFWAGYRTVSGHGLQKWAEKVLLCSWAVVWGLAAEFVFKQIFGRAWPDPTYTQNHLYGFRFLHAPQNWTSFPSGTAIGSSALATALARLFPRSRAVCAVLAAMVCIGVVVANYHWLSDSIAGAFLGISIGWMSSALLDLSVLEERE
jgi:membrane-associated phospholipid phosphatase